MAESSSPAVKTHIITLTTDLHLPPLFPHQMKSTRCSTPGIPVWEEAAKTIWRLVKAVSTGRGTFNFHDFLVTFRHYRNGDGKMSFLLATRSE